MWVVGLLIGAMIGEYVLQPEMVAATKKDSEAGPTQIQALMLHNLIWVLCTAFFGVDWATFIFSNNANIHHIALIGFVVLAVLFVGHLIVELEWVQERFLAMFGLANLDKAIETIFEEVEKSERKEAELGWMAASITYGITGHMMLSAALHCAVIWLTWQVYECMIMMIK
jgi:hypothetical protein